MAVHKHTLFVCILAALTASAVGGHGSACGDDLYVNGIEILNPCNNATYQDAMELYWRTVYSLPRDINPADATNNETNIGCPRACPELVANCGGKPKCPKKVPYLITGAWLLNFTLQRTCTNIPAGAPVIINVIDDNEFYALGLDSFTSYGGDPALFPSPQPKLFADSLVSLAEAQSRVNGTACFLAEIDGVRVPDLFSFYHVGRYVPDMSINAASFQIQNKALFNNTINTTLTDTGICRTDFANAGHYLILPEGFPEGNRTYNVTFGTSGGPTCSQGPNKWEARGIETAFPYRCWPPSTNSTTSINKPDHPRCPGETLETSVFQNLGELKTFFQYSITVGPRPHTKQEDKHPDSGGHKQDDSDDRKQDNGSDRKQEENDKKQDFRKGSTGRHHGTHQFQTKW